MAKCIVCSADFPAKRVDARFCSPKCRQKAARNPELYANPSGDISAANETKVENGAKNDKKQDSGQIPPKTPPKTKKETPAAEEKKFLNPEAPKTRRMVEPPVGSNAWFLRNKE
jgi:hypothetical protein